MQESAVLSASHLFENAIDQYLDLRKVVPMAPHVTVDMLPRYNRRRRARWLSENTAGSYDEYARTLKLFFSGMTLGAIHVGNLTAYQSARITGSEPFIRPRRPKAPPTPSP
jgi:hypothetical protein